MVEDVERLDPEVERLRLSETQVLLERHVEVIDSGTVEETAFRVAELTECLFAEEVRVEGGTALVATVGVDLERAGGELWCVEQVVVGAVAERAEQ